MKIVKVADHKVSSTNCYLFDTNIWLFIYGPVAGTDKKKQSVYSNLLRDIINCRATIFVSSLVIAEYVNAVLRIGFKQWMRRTDNKNAIFKTDYRPTDDYAEVLKDAVAQVNEILSISVVEKKPDDFHNLDIPGILASMNHNADYVDAYLAFSCEYSRLKLVSDDLDMQALRKDIVLVTA